MKRNVFGMRETKWLSGKREPDLRGIYEYKRGLADTAYPRLSFEPTGEEKRYVYVVMFGGYYFKELFNFYSDKTPTKIKGEHGHGFIMFKVDVSKVGIEWLKGYEEFDLKALKGYNKVRGERVELETKEVFLMSYHDKPIKHDTETFGMYFKPEHQVKRKLRGKCMELTPEIYDILRGKIFRREDWNWEYKSPALVSR